MPWLIWMGAKLLGIGKWLREAATALLGFVTRRPWQSAVIALCVALTVTVGMIRHRDRTIADERAKYAALVANVKSESERNRRAQAAQDADIAAVQAERNRRTNDVVAQVEKARVDAVAAYVASHRVRANAVCGSTAPAPAVSGDPGGTTQGLPDPELVAISRPDLDSLTQGALQGAAARTYLQSLVDSGQAVRR